MMAVFYHLESIHVLYTMISTPHYTPHSYRRTVSSEFVFVMKLYTYDHNYS